ncbi:MAG: PrgI family protein [Candidatus Shapirobacteria bacterium]|jgi:hypothetical protein
MEQHAIPQQISSYEFKLVGEMTLKQFLKAAVGIILAVLINTTKLVIIVKWPLMLLVGGGGLLFAFVPFEDRPLEVWVLAFIKSIYSPTIYTYKKKADTNWLELDLKNKNNESDEVEKPIENKNAFVSVAKQNDNNEIISEGHKLKDFVQSIKTFGITEKKTTQEKTETDLNASVKSYGELKEINKTETDLIASAKNYDDSKEKAKTETDWRDQKTDLNLKKEKLGATGEAVFGAIPMPDKSEIANMVVGMATSLDGKIVDGVIVEIQDEHGSPSRVIKTNSLGQFKISTPLANGRYLIIAEKEGYIFDRVNIDLNGQIVEPIRIIAHN